MLVICSCTLGHNFNLCFEDCFLTYFADEKVLKREFAFATSNFYFDFWYIDIVQRCQISI